MGEGINYYKEKFLKKTEDREKIKYTPGTEKDGDPELIAEYRKRSENRLGYSFFKGESNLTVAAAHGADRSRAEISGQIDEYDLLFYNALNPVDNPTMERSRFRLVEAEGVLDDQKRKIMEVGESIGTGQSMVPLRDRRGYHDDPMTAVAVQELVALSARNSETKDPSAMVMRIPDGPVGSNLIENSLGKIMDTDAFSELGMEPIAEYIDNNGVTEIKSMELKEVRSGKYLPDPEKITELKPVVSEIQAIETELPRVSSDQQEKERLIKRKQELEREVGQFLEERKSEFEKEFSLFQSRMQRDTLLERRVLADEALSAKIKTVQGSGEWNDLNKDILQQFDIVDQAVAGEDKKQAVLALAELVKKREGYLTTEEIIKYEKALNMLKALEIHRSYFEQQEELMFGRDRDMVVNIEVHGAYARPEGSHVLLGTNQGLTIDNPEILLDLSKTFKENGINANIVALCSKISKSEERQDSLKNFILYLHDNDYFKEAPDAVEAFDNLSKQKLEEISEEQLDDLAKQSFEQRNRKLIDQNIGIVQKDIGLKVKRDSDYDDYPDFLLKLEGQGIIDLRKTMNDHNISDPEHIGVYDIQDPNTIYQIAEHYFFTKVWNKYDKKQKHLYILQSEAARLMKEEYYTDELTNLTGTSVLTHRHQAKKKYEEQRDKAIDTNCIQMEVPTPVYQDPELRRKIQESLLQFNEKINQ
jgi:hypothetical protein